MWRARKPRSWWVTPEWVALREVAFALEMRMWQAGGAKASGKPKPPKIPEDKDPTVKSTSELRSKRGAAAAHLRKRRAQQAAVKALDKDA